LHPEDHWEAVKPAKVQDAISKFLKSERKVKNKK
jgi:hypothetical protein